MSQETADPLEKLALDAAEDVAGKGSVEQVEIVSGEEASGRPILHFSFLIDQGRARQRAGLVRTRLVQRLRDDPIAQGYGQYPIVRILNRTDWDRRANAEPL